MISVFIVTEDDMSDSGDDTDGRDIEEIELMLKKCKKRHRRSRRDNHSLEVQDQIRNRVVDLSNDLIVYYRDKFNEMESNASTPESDLENIMRKLRELYSDLITFDSVDTRGWWKGQLKKVISSLISLYRKRLSRHEAYSDAESIAEKLKSLYNEIETLDPEGADEWKAKKAEVAQELLNKRRFRWAPHVPELSLDKDALFFVNRETAVNELITVFKDIDAKRAGQAGSGGDYRIPLIDQVFGMGKTEFGLNFVKQCSRLRLADYDTTTRDVIKKLSKARTLRLHLIDGCLINPMTTSEPTDVKDALEAVLRQQIISFASDKIHTDLAGILRNDLEQSCENISFQTSDRLFKSLMARTNNDPVFVVLDDIGAAFVNDSNVSDRRDKFFEFCRVVLVPWLDCDNLYFLLMGRGDIFKWIGNRPSIENEMSLSPVKFIRIGLSMLRESKIKVIIDKTLTINRGRCTLEKYFQLEQKDIPTVVKAIMEQTNGHPRSVLDMLKACTNASALYSYRNSESLEGGALMYLISYRESLSLLLEKMEKNETVDLAEPVSEGDKRRSLALLADRARIRWEGELSKATLFATPAVRRSLSILCSSFKAFLSIYRRDPHLLVKRDRVFEYFLLKRMQDMFRDEGSPGEQYRQWFGDTAFGNLSAFRASPEILGFPKITSRSTDSKAITITAKTAHIKKLPELLQIIREKGSGCYLPLPNSSSSDGLIVYSNRQGAIKFVIIGIAAKCVSAPFSTTSIHTEIRLFNRMLAGYEAPHSGVKRSPEGDFNCLMIFSAGGFCKMNNQNRKRKKNGLRSNPVEYAFKSSDYPYVNSVLLIDLSSPTDRQEFFGIKDEETQLLQNLEFIAGPLDGNVS